MLDRVQRHFSAVSQGVICKDEDELMTSPQVVSAGCMHVSPHRFYDANRRQSVHKGLGSDRVGAALLKAGGFPLAVQQSKLAEEVVTQDVVPFQVKGGRMVKLYKGKGDARDLDCSRGLTINDHLAKSFIYLLKSDLEPH